VRGVPLARSSLDAQEVDGAILARDVYDASGRIAFHKGTVLSRDDASRLAELPWEELHLLHREPGELHEAEAGARLARVAAGPGVAPGALGRGHWPLVAAVRGILSIRTAALAETNGLDGLAVYTLYDGQVVTAGETIGRAKIIPFAVPSATMQRAEAVAAAAGGLVAVRPFAPWTVGAVVQESLGEEALARFRRALQEKVSWLGSRLLDPRLVAADAGALAAAVAALADNGAQLIVVAGSRPMDPLDPAFEALNRLAARVERRGVPAHPGSLLWLARLREIPVVGMPSCGLFSRATVFDLLLPRLLANEPVNGEWLASLGHGGLLTRDMAFRFPPYRPARSRGEVE
jgi:hypothetical protein